MMDEDASNNGGREGATETAEASVEMLKDKERSSDSISKSNDDGDGDGDGDSDGSGGDDGASFLFSDHDRFILDQLKEMDDDWDEYLKELDAKEEEGSKARTITFDMVLRRNVLLTDEDAADTDKVAEKVFQLRRVRLDNEGIHTIDNLECLGPHVTSLFLNNNMISSLGNLEALATLKSLVLANNNIHEWADLSFMRELLLLDLRNNDLAALPPAHWAPSSVSMLHLAGNPCTASPSYQRDARRLFPSLKILDAVHLLEEDDGDADVGKMADGSELCASDKDAMTIRGEQSHAKIMPKPPTSSSAPDARARKRDTGQQKAQRNPSVAKTAAEETLPHAPRSGSARGYAQKRLQRLKQIAEAEKKKIRQVSSQQQGLVRQQKKGDSARSNSTHKGKGVRKGKSGDNRDGNGGNEDEDEDEDTLDRELLHETLSQILQSGSQHGVDNLEQAVLAPIHGRHEELRQQSQKRVLQLKEDFQERVEEIKQFRMEHDALFRMANIDMSSAATIQRPQTASTLKANRSEGLAQQDVHDAEETQELASMVEKAAREAKAAVEGKARSAEATAKRSNKYSLGGMHKSRPTTAAMKQRLESIQTDLDENDDAALSPVSNPQSARSSTVEEMEHISQAQATRTATATTQLQQGKGSSATNRQAVGRTSSGKQMSKQPARASAGKSRSTSASKTRTGDANPSSRKGSAKATQMGRQTKTKNTASQPSTSGTAHSLPTKQVLPTIGGDECQTLPSQNGNVSDPVTATAIKRPLSGTVVANKEPLPRTASSAGKKPKRLGSAPRKATSMRLKPLDAASTQQATEEDSK